MSFDEFCDMNASPKVRTYLDYLGLEVPSLEMFFSMLSDETEQVNIPDFVAACMRLRGEAKSIDMKQLLLELKVAKALRRDVKSIKKYLVDGKAFLGSSKQDSPDMPRDVAAGRRVSSNSACDSAQGI